MKAELAQVISKKILSYTDSNNKLQFQDENVEYEERKQVSEKEYLDESLLLRGKIIQHISENVLLVKIVEFPLNIFGTEAENVAVTFPKDCEELQKADNEKMFIRAVRDNLYSYTDIFGAKTTVKKYRYIESKNIFDVEIEGVNELEMYQLCNYLLELN